MNHFLPDILDLAFILKFANILTKTNKSDDRKYKTLLGKPVVYSGGSFLFSSYFLQNVRHSGIQSLEV